MFSSKVFILPLSDLLFNFFNNKVDCSVEIAFNIFGKKIWARKRKAKGAGELLVRGLGFIMLESHPSIDRIAVQVRQLLNFADDVIFDGFGQCYVVRRKDQVHGVSMESGSNKIQ